MNLIFQRKHKKNDKTLFNDKIITIKRLQTRNCFYFVTLAIFELDSITVVPVFTTFAIVTESMFQTLLAETAETITGVGIAHLNVAVTLARLTEVA